MPLLAQLPQPGKQLSLAGPGWLALEPTAVVQSAGLTPGADLSISLDGSADYAYAIYGVYGFDGDNGPTSARITSPALSGKFYVGFSDYEHGKWVLTGPYSFGSNGGTTEITIPNTGEYVSPNSFIAKYYSATYLAVIAQKGAALTDATVELGVHGGMLGPRPAYAVQGSGGPTGMTVRWFHSPDSLQPDFAGYIVQRAEQFGGEFTPIAAGLLRGDFTFDDATVINTQYRYRIASEDNAGHRSLWVEGFGIRTIATTQPPVPVVAGLPEQACYGPVELTLDLSGSYDPGGAAITNYRVEETGKILYDGPGYAVNLTLHPGCYALRFTVTANVAKGTTTRLLKVLPKWRPGATLVAAPVSQNAVPRVGGYGLAQLADGAFYLSGYDPFIPAFTVRRLKVGEPPQLCTWPVYDELQEVSEPVVLDNEIYYALGEPDEYNLIKFDGERFSQQYSHGYFGTQSDHDIAVATDGESRIWTVYTMLDMTLSLSIGMNNVYAPVVLIDPLPSLLDLDAVYDPAADMVWIVYSTNADTQWIKFNPATYAIEDSGQLTGFPAPKIDMEYDPVNNIPAVAFHNLGNTYYTYNDGIWHLWEQVDPSGGNGTALDLEFLDGKPRVFTSDIGAQASVYTRDAAASWSARNVAYSTNSGLDLALAAYLDGTAAAYFVADTGVNRHCYSVYLNGDSTETVMQDLWPTTGQGLQMHGVGGADGLHIVYDQMFGGMLHFKGNADGQDWSSEAVPASASQLDLSALSDGTVYLSYFSGAEAKLDRWDGAAWINEWAQASQVSYRPFLAHGMAQNLVSWVCANGLTLEWTAVQGDHVNGFTSETKPFAGELAWSGTGLVESTISPAGSSTIYYTLNGLQAFGYTASNVGEFHGLEAEDNVIAYTLRNYEAFYDNYIYGRNLACAEYAGFAGGGDNVLWLSSGTTIPAARYTPNSSLVGEFTELPTDMTQPGYDLRRTVAAMTASSATAVGLVCDLSGHDQYLEWSNFGDWEALPLPPPDVNYASDKYMNQAELFCGRDGRWHIVYRNYDTDSIYIRSTE